MSRRNLKAEILAAIRNAPKGTTYKALMLQLGISRSPVLHYSGQLRREELVAFVSCPKPGSPNFTMIFSTEHKPEALPIPRGPSPAKPLTHGQGLGRMLRPDAPVIVPDNVKVTRAEPFVDRRWHVDLPSGGGQITRDWRERRMQELRA